jgi:LemA protein
MITVLLLTILSVFILLLVLAGLWAAVYNRLVTLKNRFRYAFAQIDAQLQRRYDLALDLVNAARVYASHDPQALEAVIEAVILARDRAVSAQMGLAGDPAQLSALGHLIEADSLLSAALDRLLTGLADGPGLLETKEGLADAENRLVFARQAYNDAVMLYNEDRERFPAVLFSEMFGFGLAEFWPGGGGAAAAPPKVVF